MTFHLLRNRRSKVLALVTVLGVSDSLITFGVSAVTFGCENEGGKTCTQVGCGPVTVHIATVPAMPMGERLTFTLCRENACLSGDFTLGNADASSPDTTVFTARPALSSWPYASVTVGHSGINIMYVDYGFTDGDRYTVTIEDSDGQELLNRETTVTYTKSYPNGPDCDPHPCMQADVTM